MPRPFVGQFIKTSERESIPCCHISSNINICCNLATWIYDNVSQIKTKNFATRSISWRSKVSVPFIYTVLRNLLSKRLPKMIDSITLSARFVKYLERNRSEIILIPRNQSSKQNFSGFIQTLNNRQTISQGWERFQ